MAKQNSNSKQLSAQEHLQLDMENRTYNAQDIWNVLVAASVERISIEMASRLLEGALSGTMVRTIVKQMLQDMGGLTAVEPQVNEVLTAKLPRKLVVFKSGAFCDQLIVVS